MASELPTPETLFHRALNLRGKERNDFLTEACRGDANLRRRVENLLRAHENAGDFLSLHPKTTPPGTTLSEREGSVIGRYTLLEKIGEGGFGIVYMAEQKEPVRRLVALKIIKLGMDTRQVVARFEAERQILALLDHPNIAKVFDAGATETGRPYFVMELVQGTPITKYCDKEKLNIEARVDLLIQVCHAIQHAHQKGIVHRDIKPSNVLVTIQDGLPMPKVIDFGIAKATQQELLEKSVFTQYSQLIGTPSYMSPEQAEMAGQDIDTRSDIYGLGVLFYELLTSQTPLDLKKLFNSGYDEICRRIREEEPLKPSTRVITLLQQERVDIARRRQTDPSKLRHLLQGDLDWIVMKCLEKDRTRRYETASELGADLKRHRNHEPVIAGPPSIRYKTAKFVRRYKTAVLGTAIASAALIIGGAVATWQAVLATQALTVARLSEAELAFDKGQLLGEQGDANQALLWLSRSLKLAPPDAHTLRMAIRRGISSWAREAVSLQQVFPETGRVSAVCLSSDHSTLYTASAVNADGFLFKAWSRATGKEIRKPIEHFRGEVTSLCFSPDASMLAIGYRDGRVEVLNATHSNGPLRPMPSAGGPVTTMEFSPDASFLLVACVPEERGETLPWKGRAVRGPGWVWLFNLETGQPAFQTPLEHDRTVWAAAFSSDSTQFVTETSKWLDMENTGRVHFWDLTGTEIRGPLEHAGPALDVAISPDKTKLLTGHWNSKALLWDLNQRNPDQLIAEIPCNSPARFVAFSGANKIFIAGFAGTAQLLDFAGKPLSPPLWHNDLVRCIALPEQGKWIIIGGLHGARAWKVQTDASEPPEELMPETFPLAFSEDGQAMLVYEDEALRLQEVLTGKQLGKPIDCEAEQITGAISSDYRFAATIGAGKKIILWDMANGKLLTRLEFPLDAYSLAFSPDGRILASGHFDMNAVLWDTSYPFEIKRQLKYPHHTGPMFTVQFSPDGKSILTGGAATMARLWNVESGEVLKDFLHGSGVVAANFNRDGTFIVTAGVDQAARVWDLATAKQTSAPLLHNRSVTAARFSPDGRLILTGSKDGTARLWDFPTSKQIGPSMKNDDAVFSVNFWPDKKSIIVGMGRDHHLAPNPTKMAFGTLVEPMRGTTEQIELQIEIITGLELLENGDIGVLTMEEWIQRHEELQMAEPFHQPM